MSPGVDDALYSELVGPRWLYWSQRAQNLELTPRQREYAARRAAALDRPYSARLARCGQSGTVVKCGCPGKRDVRWRTCRQHLMCDLCRRRRAKRMRARVRSGLERELELAPNLKTVLVTITLRHSGDVQRDRAALARGWRRFYRAYHKRWGAFAYVGTWEVTAGRDGLGHPHAHVVARWPFRDWSELRALWLAACPESSQISFVASHGVKAAARYVTKYVSKGVDTGDFSPELRARVLAGTYGTRWVFSSRAFFVPFSPRCPNCGHCVVPARLWVGAPAPVPDVEDREPEQMGLPNTS